MPQKQFSFKLLALLFLLVLLLVACQPATPTPTAEPVEQPPVEEPATETPAEPEAPADPNAISREIVLDPALATDEDSIRINQYLYTGLVTLDADGNPQAGIAESWLVSEDLLAYTFTLRPDAAFSDGTPITPDDIVANVERWLDPESPLRGTGNYVRWQEVFLGFLGEKDTDGRPLSPVDGVNKIEFNTVVIHLNRPVPELLTYLADPAFAVLKPDSIVSGNYGTINSQIISTGPYLVSSWTNEHLVLSPNPHYWGDAAQAEMEFPLR